MTDLPTDRQPPGGPSETEALLEDILATYWQEALDAIAAGDQQRTETYIAFIGRLTGRSGSGPAIPDLSLPERPAASGDQDG